MSGEMPERIYVHPDVHPVDENQWDKTRWYETDVEYVRADLVAEFLAEKDGA